MNDLTNELAAGLRLAREMMRWPTTEQVERIRVKVIEKMKSETTHRNKNIGDH